MVVAFAINGLEAIAVDVQVRFLPGLPAFIIVGLPDKIVGESRERIRAAINSMGLSIPLKKIVVNLSPANIHKEGSHYDLPIIIGLLQEMGVISPNDIKNSMIVGELSLDGDIIGVRGVLSAAVLAKRMNVCLICPHSNGPEAAIIDNLEVLAPQNVMQLINYFKRQYNLPVISKMESKKIGSVSAMDKITGHSFAKRSAEIAIAGGHNIILIGPPGSGKSMLARSMVELLPPMSPSEAIEVNVIRSLSSEAFECFSLDRPYRSPHHSCSMAAMVGGGKYARPGEVSMAHNGVLFLDELPEFPHLTIEALRQPLEMRCVSIARAEWRVTYPAKFSLVAAMNPCRCGYAGTSRASCSNQAKCVANYVGKISGPILDRIDIFISMEPVDILGGAVSDPVTAGQAIAKRIALARQLQSERYKNHNCELNAETSWDTIKSCGAHNQDSIAMIRSVSQKKQLSTRAITKLFQVSRTVADLAGCKHVATEHVAESIILCNKELIRENV